MRASTLGFVFFAIAGCAGGGDDDDGGGTPPPSGGEEICGDGLCAASEVGSCKADCGGSTGAVCGNNTCDAGESNANCPNDCPTATQSCGNNTCEAGEDATNCPSDCGGNTGGTLDCNDQMTLLGCFSCILDPTTCAPPFTEEACTTCFGGGGMGAGCGDGVCDAATEDPNTCPLDCP